MTLFPDIFADIAAATPDRIAVSDSKGSMTYGELDAASSSLAALLAAKGVGRGDAVAVLVPRCKEIVLGAVAAFKAGGAFLPVDDAYPTERISYMLSDCNCAAVITFSELWNERKPDGFAGPVIFLDGEIPAATIERAAHEPSDPAMILYTSGTTGNPKGVLHTHSSLMGVMRSFQSCGNGMDASSRAAVFSGFTFIATSIYLFTPLTVGGSTRIIEDELRRNLQSLYDCISGEGITHIFFPPAFGSVMVETYDMSGTTMLFAGEKLQPFKPKVPCRILNAYGSTEGVIIAASWVQPELEEIPLGRPCDGVATKVEESGELLYSSDFMASCYLNLPEQTAEKWTMDDDGRRWFHTGDRVRVDESGVLYYLGRMDGMVKLHGFRIELGEVESRIIALGIREVSCAVRKVRGSDHLCCFYESHEELDHESLKEQLSRTLAPYMIPTAWVRLDALPRNANGKIVRRLLPDPKIRLCEYVGPGSMVESVIAQSVAEVLGMQDPVSMKESFVSLGGDSLMSMKLSARLREHGIDVDSYDILRVKTIAEIAAAAKVQYEMLWSEEEYDRVRDEFLARGVHVQKVIPLSDEQDELLFRQLLHPDDPQSYYTCNFSVDTPISSVALGEALETLADRFEFLRASVVYTDISVIQAVITDRRIPYTVVDASDSASMREQIAEFDLANRPFVANPETAPMMRVLCINMSEDEALLVVCVQKFMVSHARLRWYLAELFGMLAARYPASEEFPGWKYFLSQPQQDDEPAEPEIDLNAARKESGIPEEMFVYSDIPGAKKVVYVHTANTGSEAYYSLAQRIAPLCSFSVIEQFNIYHPQEAVYGIAAIARKYVEILRRHQPEGPYNLGGWCYGGMIAYEMACMLEAEGEKVESLVMFDSQVVTDSHSRELARENHRSTGRDYFENCALFEGMRSRGMLETLIDNYRHIAHDVVEYTPSHYNGRVLFFKPEVAPAGLSAAGMRYYSAIAAHRADGYEGFVDLDKLEVVHTPHEHDLMMDNESLEITVPKILEFIGL